MGVVRVRCLDTGRDGDSDSDERQRHGRATVGPVLSEPGGRNILSWARLLLY